MSKNLQAKLNKSLEDGSLFEIVDSSLASTQVLAKLGFSNNGRYVGIVKQYLIDNEIDTSHFTSNGRPNALRINKSCPVCNSIFTITEKDNNQTVCSRSCSNTYFRSGKNHPNYTTGASSYRSRALAFFGSKCCECGFDKEEVLQVHHIDKNRQNNDLSNLIVLCANCHLLKHHT